MPLESQARVIVSPKEAYDNYASRYDTLLDENWINAYLRRQTLRALETTFPPGFRVLELGCGTGDEALALAARGCFVVALDPAPAMVKQARRKAKEQSSGGRVEFVVGAAREVGDLVQERGAGPFDGAFSNFSLSYESDLSPVGKALASLIKPEGRLVFSVMNRLCGLEWILALGSGRPALAGRRLSSSTLHKVGKVHTPIYPRLIKEVLDGLGPQFRLERVRALPVLLPPHYANRAIRRFPPLFSILEALDRQISVLPVMRLLGDHHLLWLRRLA